MNSQHTILNAAREPTTSNYPSTPNFSQYTAQQPRQGNILTGLQLSSLTYLHSFFATSIQKIISFPPFSPPASFSPGPLLLQPLQIYYYHLPFSCHCSLENVFDVLARCLPSCPPHFRFMFQAGPGYTYKSPCTSNGLASSNVLRGDERGGSISFPPNFPVGLASFAKKE